MEEPFNGRNPRHAARRARVMLAAIDRGPTVNDAHDATHLLHLIEEQGESSAIVAEAATDDVARERRVWIHAEEGEYAR